MDFELSKMKTRLYGVRYAFDIDILDSGYDNEARLIRLIQE
jgi:hypothetical protein